MHKAFLTAPRIHARPYAHNAPVDKAMHPQHMIEINIPHNKSGPYRITDRGLPYTHVP